MLSSLRLIHISDLHFGEQYYQRPRKTQTFGQQRHSSAAAEALALAVQEIRSRKDGEYSVPTRVIATGDLTAAGTAPSLETAFRYLRKAGPKDYPPGLAESCALAVPGDQDMGKAGAEIRASESARRAWQQRFLPPPDAQCDFEFLQSGSTANGTPANWFPYRVPLISGSLEISLYGLDSTAGVSPDGPPESGAIGQDQRDRLVAMVKEEESREQPGKQRIRIAAIHHALTGRPSAGLAGLLTDRKAVSETLQRLGFLAVLSGYTPHAGSAEGGYYVGLVRPDEAYPVIYSFTSGATLHAGGGLDTYEDRVHQRFNLYEFSLDEAVDSLTIALTVYCRGKMGHFLRAAAPFMIEVPGLSSYRAQF